MSWLVQKHANRWKLSVFLFLATISIMIFSSTVNTVRADVPSVLQIENISQDSTGKIKLQISHATPSTNHYVDLAEVDVNGQVTRHDREPQSSDPFTLELNLGQIQGKPTVKARAHCNMHGWSSWSDGILVPEFSQVGLTVLAALVATLFVLRRTWKK